MAWAVRRTGSKLQVDIQLPVDDWEAVLDGVRDRIRPDVTSIVVPRELPGASATEATLLRLLGQALAQQESA
jgi:hypothetical protein